MDGELIDPFARAHLLMKPARKCVPADYEQDQAYHSRGDSGSVGGNLGHDADEVQDPAKDQIERELKWQHQPDAGEQEEQGCYHNKAHE